MVTKTTTVGTSGFHIDTACVAYVEDRRFPSVVWGVGAILDLEFVGYLGFSEVCEKYG